MVEVGGLHGLIPHFYRTLENLRRRGGGDADVAGEAAVAVVDLPNADAAVAEGSVREAGRTGLRDFPVLRAVRLEPLDQRHSSAGVAAEEAQVSGFAFRAVGGGGTG